jgi:hypothetical protein
MINKWVYTLYFLGLSLFLCFQAVNAILLSLEIDLFSATTTLTVVLIDLLLPAYFSWRLYNFFISKEKNWLPQLESKRSWYVIVGLCIMWPIVFVALIFLITLIKPDAAAMAAIIVFGVASLFKYLPIILIEIGYLNARNQQA